MYLLTQQNGPVRHVVSLYSERGSGDYTEGSSYKEIGPRNVEGKVSKRFKVKVLEKIF